MKKVVNIDDILAENELCLILGGREYKLQDIQLRTYMKALKQISDESEPAPDKVYDQLAALLGVPAKDLKEEVGLKGAGVALNEISKWVTDTMPAAETEDGNP